MEWKSIVGWHFPVSSQGPGAKPSNRFRRYLGVNLDLSLAGKGIRPEEEGPGLFQQWGGELGEGLVVIIDIESRALGGGPSWSRPGSRLEGHLRSRPHLHLFFQAC